jgi:hypothetical protein
MTLEVLPTSAADVCDNTHSSTAAYQTCARMYWIQYHLGIRPKKTAKPLRFGSAYHLGLDVRRKGASIDNAINAAVDGYQVLPDWVNTAELLEEWAVERETVANLMAGYFWYWQNDEIKVIASEQSFSLPIRNPSTGRKSARRNRGKIDMIAELPDGRTILWEEKTTGDPIAPDSDYWLALKIDSQLSRYVYAARTKYPVVSTMYSVSHKPDIAPRKIPLLDEHGFKIVLDADGNRVMLDGKHNRPRQSGDKEKGWTLQARRESAEEFGKRLLEDITARPEVYYARREIPRLQSDLDEFELDLWHVNKQIDDSIRHGRWPRNTKACRSPYRCQYLSVCQHNFAESVPDGFERVAERHPELSEEGTQ